MSPGFFTKWTNLNSLKGAVARVSAPIMAVLLFTLMIVFAPIMAQSLMASILMQMKNCVYSSHRPSLGHQGGAPLLIWVRNVCKVI
jgi:hypothetical protein